MIEVLQFIFQDFWHWIGTVILIAIITGPFYTMFSCNKEINNYSNDKKEETNDKHS